MISLFLWIRRESRLDLRELKTEFKKDIYETRTELKKDIYETRTELKKDISEVRVELKKDISDQGNKIDFMNVRLSNVEGEVKVIKEVLLPRSYKKEMAET